MTTPTGLEPTQTRRPWRATVRTAVAVGLAAILLLPTIIQIVVDELGPSLPDRYRAGLVLAGVIVTAIAAAITRILALAPVELALRRYGITSWLAAQPRPKPDDSGPGDAGHARVDFQLAVALVAAAAIAVTATYLTITGGAA